MPEPGVPELSGHTLKGSGVGAVIRSHRTPSLADQADPDFTPLQIGETIQIDNFGGDRNANMRQFWEKWEQEYGSDWRQELGVGDMPVTEQRNGDMILVPQAVHDHAPQTGGSEGER